MELLYFLLFSVNVVEYKLNSSFVSFDDNFVGGDSVAEVFLK